jgi:hypothetical protein
MPERVESTLLVVEDFRDAAGTDWRIGDRASLHHRHVREAALANPEWFAMEFATDPVDGEWLRELTVRYDAEYLEVKRGREGRKASKEKALLAELKEQDRPESKDLQRLFEQQERDDEERRKRIREESERRSIESELAYGGGFHYDQ